MCKRLSVCSQTVKSGSGGSRRAAALALAVCLLVLCLPGCGQQSAVPPELPVSQQPVPVQYDASTLSCTIAGKAYANLFEYSASPNKRYWIYVASQLNGEPEAWLYDSAHNIHAQLTDNGYYIESEVRVTDSGDWALSLTEASNSISRLLYNGAVIADAGMWHHSLCFLDNNLFFTAYAPATRTTAFCLYNPSLGETKTITSGRLLNTGKSAATGWGTILAEAYDSFRQASVVLEIDPQAATEAESLKFLTDGTQPSQYLPWGALHRAGHRRRQRHVSFQCVLLGGAVSARGAMERLHRFRRQAFMERKLPSDRSAGAVGKNPRPRVKIQHHAGGPPPARHS